MGGDVYLPRLADGTQDHIGSRLWLLSRALQIKETAQRAQAYVKESLKWVEDDGIGKVTVPLPTFSAPGHDGDHRHHQPEDANRHSRPSLHRLVGHDTQHGVVLRIALGGI